jgi:aspartyl-tRNA(Asn)/glutamyl-tRNA(Gln) amidotransferase subunit A
MPTTPPRLDAVPATYRLDLMPYNSPAALLGLPVTIVPCGFVDDLPVALALNGRRGEDGVPLATAEWFQKVTDWHLRRPVDHASATELYTSRLAQPGRG